MRRPYLSNDTFGLPHSMDLLVGTAAVRTGAGSEKVEMSLGKRRGWRTSEHMSTMSTGEDSEHGIGG